MILMGNLSLKGVFILKLLKRKFIFALALFVFVAAQGLITAEAELVKPTVVGVLTKENMTQEEFLAYMDSARESGKWTVYYNAEPKPMQFVYFYSFNTMRSALSVKEADEIILPKLVGEFLLNTTPDIYSVAGVSMTAEPSCLAFGFRRSDGLALRDNFDKALKEMKADGTLSRLQSMYLTDEKDNLKSVEIAEFNDADTIKVAVTGDLPPIDSDRKDNTPRGFSTALLAEIGKRLHLNIRFVNVAAGSRAIFLASKRVDVVLWFRFDRGQDRQPDVLDGVILSEPYYEWNEYLHIRQTQF